MVAAFSFARIPPLHLGVGTPRQRVPWLQRHRSRRVLVVTGASSLERMGRWEEVQALVAASTR